MKQIDYEKGNIVTIIIQSSIPIMIAQMINLLYNIVDRIYIARIPGIGTQSLGAVGLCFPVILIILAFTNLFGSGGSPLFAIERGRKNNMEAKAIMDTCFILLIITSLILMIIGWMASREILTLLGASEENLVLGIPYLQIYILGTVFSMVATGMNPFIQAQGYPSIAMISVTVGAILNLILDPLFIFVIGLQIRGAAIATVLSQAVSACIVLYFLFQKTEIKLFPCSFSLQWNRIGHIVGLGTASFVMVMTNSLVQMACNHTLVLYGGDMYISVMTVLSSVRQLIETPIGAIKDGSSPVLCYHYGGMHY
ncbi:MAG: polysaccharide biosynthesis C-terminal domain-containing protein, partial [Erysipelotrichaceae bacterium]|nr:polysaccharide biosynthesis C-terminal domain-containing protein [Erysipelotrichaceae bacterium]